MSTQSNGSRGIASALAVSLLLGMTVFFFSPAEIYLNSPLDFQLDPAHALIPMLLTAAAVAAVLFLLLMLLHRLSPKGAAAVKCLLFGITLAGYVQMMFLNGHLGQLDGVSEGNHLSQLAVNLNWFLLLAIALLPLILYAATEKNPDSGFGKIVRGKKTLPFLCVLLLLMQTGGFASLIPALNQARKIENRQDYLSYDPALSLSAEENIVVFLTDRMDGLWFDEVLETDPSINEMLEGFTFYQNNVSNHTMTYPSAASMLSGIPTAAESMPSEYFSRIWSDDTNLLKKLHDAGWANYVLFDQGAIVSSLSQIGEWTDNMRQTETAPKYNYLGADGIIRVQTELSLLRMTPYLLKELFRDFVDPDWFMVYADDQPDRLARAITPQADLYFNSYLETHALRSDSSRKTASFIHLNCAHDKDAALAALCPANPSGADSPVATACGSFMIIGRYLEQLKQAGIYDNTTVLILGDHGRFPSETAFYGQDELNGPILTTLLIKPAGALHEPLQTDAETELSNAFFSASVLEYAGLDHSAYGISYHDVAAEDLHPERILYMNHEETKRYRITGNARDFSNWTYENES